MKVVERVQAAWRWLSARERRTIRNLSYTSQDAILRCRCKVISSLARNRTPTEIARGGLCSSSQVYRVAERFVEHGLPGLSDGREDNGEPKVTDDYERWLLAAVVGSPEEFGYRRPTWTQELLIKVLDKLAGIRVSRTTMSRTLHRLGVRRGRPKPIVECPWTEAQKTRRLQSLRRLVRTVQSPEVVVYLDEVDIHLNPKIGPDWMIRGVQKQVLTPGKNEKRYLAGALDAHSGRLTWVEWDRKTSDLFIRLLWQLVKTYPNAPRIHVILDNYRIHHSQRTELALAGLGGRIKLHFLPPYCPDHNRIERTWKDLHDNVTRNHRQPDMRSLLRAVRIYLRSKSRQLQRRYSRKAA